MKLDEYITNEKINYFTGRLEKHKSLVSKFCCFFYLYDPIKYADILIRAIKHDLTKYSDQLCREYIVLTWKKKLESEGKSVDLPQEILDEIKQATNKHVRLEKHHPAYFSNDLIPESEACKQMHDLDIAEQVADCLSMAEELNTDVYQYFKDNIGTRWNYLESQISLIYELLAIAKLYDEKYKEL